MKIRTVTTKHTKTRRRVAEGEIEACCHRITFWFDVGGVRLTAEDLERLEEEAEERARHCIAEDYLSGELHCILLSPVRQQDREFRGWWSIAA